jgi:choline dehydrogenase
MRTADVIVVGGGSAGCLLAKRIATETKARVVLLEAGARAPLWTRVPIGYLRSIGNARVDWLFQTEPEPGLHGRVLRYPRGKALGGCSVINGMIHMRGQSRDYDGWADLLGEPSWRYEHVLKLFKRHEDHWGGASDLHGAAAGEWRVEKQRLTWEILDAFASACEEAGIPKVADFNTGNNFGVSRFEVAQKGGWRFDASRAFLSSVPPSLTIETGVEVDRLVMEGTRVLGVRLCDGSTRLAGEVILSAGAIGSPSLLERSGVGSATVLEKAGVRCVHNLPQVGENLQDHLQMRHVFQVSNVKTLNTMSRNALAVMGIGWDYLFKQMGPLSMAPSQLGVFASTHRSPEPAWPNVQYHVQPLSLPAFGEPLHLFDGFTAAICNLRPTSRGAVHIRSSRADTAPVIAPRYLSTEDDRTVAADSIRLTRKIVASKALQKYCPVEVLPGVSYESDSDEQLAKAAGVIGTTIFHPVGTCALGTVCDAQSMRVLGLENVRVCDASVMPRITSGNTQSPTMMIAEKLAQSMV